MLSSFHKVEDCLLKPMETCLTLCTPARVHSWAVFPGYRRQGKNVAPGKSSLGLNPGGSHETPINYTTELPFVEVRGAGFSNMYQLVISCVCPY